MATFTSANIGYLSDPCHTYMEALNAVQSLRELRALGRRWRELCWDAHAAIQAMDEVGFAYYAGALAMERRGRYMGDDLMERFGAILIPETLAKVALVASRCKVPWGTAFIQLREAGRVLVQDGRCIVDLEAVSA